jgi:hypothetical protein
MYRFFITGYFKFWDNNLKFNHWYNTCTWIMYCMEKVSLKTEHFYYGLICNFKVHLNFTLEGVSYWRQKVLGYMELPINQSILCEHLHVMSISTWMYKFLSCDWNSIQFYCLHSRDQHYPPLWQSNHSWAVEFALMLYKERKSAYNLIWLAW